MICFFTGVIAGALFGVSIMCLLIVSREERHDNG